MTWTSGLTWLLSGCGHLSEPLTLSLWLAAIPIGVRGRGLKGRLVRKHLANCEVSHAWECSLLRTSTFLWEQLFISINAPELEPSWWGCRIPGAGWVPPMSVLV